MTPPNLRLLPPPGEAAARHCVGPPPPIPWWRNYQRLALNFSFLVLLAYIAGFIEGVFLGE